MTPTDSFPAKPVADVILIGAGITSATLGVLLKALDPTLTITDYERLDAVAAESSDAALLGASPGAQYGRART